MEDPASRALHEAILAESEGHRTESSRDERETPQPLFDALNERFHFCWDAAATAENCKVNLPMEDDLGEVLDRACYFGPDHPREDWRDAIAVDWTATLVELFAGPSASTPVYLSRIWRPTVWINPPWSRGQIARWCWKASEEANKGLTTVMLLPADPSTRWFHDYVLFRPHWFQRGRNAYAGEQAVLTREGKLANDKKGAVLALFEPPMPERWARGGR